MGRGKKQPLSELQLPTNAQNASEGNSMMREAVDGLSKALKRGKKRQKTETENAEGLETQPADLTGSVPRRGGTSLANGSKAKSNTKSKRQAASLVEEDQPSLGTDDSDEEGEEWEPDWYSDDDEAVPDLFQEDGLTAQKGPGGLLELQALVSDGDASDTPLASRKKRSKGGSRKPKKEQNPLLDEDEANHTKTKKGRGKKHKAGLDKNAEDGEAAAEEEGPYTDDEIWKIYEEKAELDEAYVPKPLPEMEPPKELLMPLLPYQKGFLGWAVSQERGDIKGGILADEMGMGKTIQAISLIVAHRTDDNSKLEQLEAAPLVAAKPKNPGNRPKLTLMNPAPPPSDSQAPKQPSLPNGNQAAPHKDSLEAAPGIGGNNWLAGQPHSKHIHVEDTVVPDLIAEQSPGDLQTMHSLKGPDSLVPPADRPTPSKVMAVGESGCGKNEQAARGPAGKFARATLVICPVVAVIQWREEIAKYVQPGTLKVVVYHGNKRATDAKELEQADVVLTTYSIAENEFRRHTQPVKATCSYCNKKFYPERLKVHLRFFCGPNAKKSDALAKQQRKRPRAGDAQDDESDDDDDFEPDDDEAQEEEEEEDGDSDCEHASAVKRGRKSKPDNAKGTSAGKKASKQGGSRPSKKAAGKASKVAKAGKLGQASKGGAKGSKKKDKSASKAKASSKASKDPDFSSEEDMSESEEDNENARIRPVKVKNAAGWAAKAQEEAERMIAEAAQNNEKASDVGPSILHQVRWRRIILDEAHSIKDRRSSTARAIFALESQYKWALSGTPLQNRVSELYSLVRFLRLYPYAYYFCNSGRSKAKRKLGKQDPCCCKSLDYSFRTNCRQCDHCGHSPLHHYCYWNKWVANPIKKYGYVGRGQSAMLLLKTEILEKILLRRTKIQCADVLALPPRTVVLRKDKFDEREEDFYEALYTQSQAQFDSYVQTSTVLNNYAHVFSLLVRLRQAVNHPYLVVHSASAPQGQGEKQAVGACTICHDPLEDGIAAKCGHAFCRACITDYLQSASDIPMCMACDKPITIDLATAPKATASRMVGTNQNSIINRISLANFQSSTKIEALLEELHRMMSRDSSAKAIVFSQFTSMLDLIHFRLQQVGIMCVRLEGSMEMKQRDRMIETFSSDASVKVFLMSLKAGGVALNLTAASHVMLMDPWWNPAVEQQAQDRIHRLGQYKPIHVTRYVIGGTIEERILKLQEKKQLVFEGTVGQNKEALGRLTEDDLRFLFA